MDCGGLWVAGRVGWVFRVFGWLGGVWSGCSVCGSFGILGPACWTVALLWGWSLMSDYGYWLGVLWLVPGVIVGAFAGYAVVVVGWRSLVAWVSR